MDWREIHFQALAIQKKKLKKKKTETTTWILQTNDNTLCCGSIHRDLSFVVMWINLESVVQNEVNQKGKNKYHLLTHIYGI